MDIIIKMPKDTPRVHYQDLEFRDNGLGDGEDILCTPDQPFSGIAWRELQGITTEDIFRNGVLHGECIKTYPNGSLAAHGLYQHGKPIGQFRKWFASGQLSSVKDYEASPSHPSEREYNASGILVKEVIEKPQRRISFWNEDGKLAYRSENGFREIYSPNQQCVIRKSDKDSNFVVYNDDALVDHAFSMLTAELDIVVYPVIDWLKTKISENHFAAKKLLIDLLKHPRIDIVEASLFIIEQHNLTEASLAVLPLAYSRARKKTGQGYYLGNTAKLAQRVLTKLLANADEVVKAQAERYREAAARVHAELSSKNEIHAARILELKQKWPIADASYQETYTGEGTIKSGAQIFNDEVKSQQLIYFHVYTYCVDKKTYRAVVTSERPATVQEKKLHYRRKHPEQFYFRD